MLLVNRAMCQKNRGHWDDVEADSRRALELDSRSMKVGDASHAYFIRTPDHAMQLSANLTYQAGSVLMAFALASMWAEKGRMCMLGVGSTFLSDSVVRFPGMRAVCLVSRHACWMGGLTANFCSSGKLSAGHSTEGEGRSGWRHQAPDQGTLLSLLSCSLCAA